MNLILNNRQRTCRLEDAETLLRVWQRAAELADLDALWPAGTDLTVTLLGARPMARLNRRFLDHVGPTDVLAFDYRDDDLEDGDTAAEIFVCPRVAVDNAQRFGTTVSSEIVLYGVHGLLHLAGGRDKAAPERRQMRHREQRLMQQLRREFDLDALFVHGRDTAAESSA